MLIAVEIDQVQAFVAIVRGGGFTRAASILHLSQPGGQRAGPTRRRDAGAALRRRPAPRDARDPDLRRADDGRLLAAPPVGAPSARRAVGARRRTVGGVSAAQRRVLRSVSLVA